MEEIGITALSLRRLAERVGVSPPALYHHFRNKQDLLLALGEAGMARFEALLAEANAGQPSTLDGFVSAYVRFAQQHPEVYDLVFGRDNWKDLAETDFHRHARARFRALGDTVAEWQRSGQLDARMPPLRQAQIVWALLHGLCRMYNDGLAFSADTIEDIARQATQLLKNQAASASDSAMAQCGNGSA